MNRSSVLIDTSVWISYFRDEISVLGKTTAQLLKDNRAVLNPLIRLELLTGAKDDRQYHELEDAFQGLLILELNSSIWKLAEEMRYRLNRKGFLIPASDILIASTAIHYHSELLHADKHFSIIASHYPLKIHS